MRNVGVMVLVCLLIGIGVRTGTAVPQFQKVFMDEYIKNHKDKDFQKMVKTKAGCLICHQGKKNRKNHNPYGEHLEQLLDKKKDGKDVEKIKAVLAKVGKFHSDPKDEKSPTYDELIADSKLPGGTLEELLKEPEKEESEEAGK